MERYDDESRARPERAPAREGTNEAGREAPGEGTKSTELREEEESRRRDTTRTDLLGSTEEPVERDAVQRPGESSATSPMAGQTAPSAAEPGTHPMGEPVTTPQSEAGAPSTTDQREQRTAMAGAVPAPQSEPRPDRSPTPDQSAPVSNLPGGATTAERAAATSTAEQPGMFGREDAETYQRRWDTIQSRFIDDPRAATQEADNLVGEVMERMVQLRQQHHGELRAAAERGGDTEGLRLALQRYRAFFLTLLNA